MKQAILLSFLLANGVTSDNAPELRGNNRELYYGFGGLGGAEAGSQSQIIGGGNSAGDGGGISKGGGEGAGSSGGFGSGNNKGFGQGMGNAFTGADGNSAMVGGFGSG